ncbi:SDR family NAD(P)-dependent oxidoreductase [Sphingobacteriales bacterium UPWRP_1]|nr:oxidoreductase [Sphingobacteriales bacterium TSM_CSS]PSJ77237.1 SDR family NAD(P)-dependent oxidoreductase [Sphingobacteriales bacterium UPWRP_1]
MQNKNILVIGASSGIGLSVAKLAVQNGANLYTVSRRSTAALQDLSTRHYVLDVVSEDIVLPQLPDALHGLVYCPGSITLKPFHRLTEKDIRSDYDINVGGAVKVLQALYPNLKKSGNGSVVLFSTVAAQVGMSHHASITMAKSALEGLGKSLAAEWAGSSIRVNVIAPSLTDTPLATSLLSTPEKREASAKRHPLGRVGTPEDMAAAVVFLLSDASAWITGQVLHIDGGMSSVKML